MGKARVDKAYREIRFDVQQREKNKQVEDKTRKQGKKGKGQSEEICAYVDSARNISVSFDNEDLTSSQKSSFGGFEGSSESVGNLYLNYTDHFITRRKFVSAAKSLRLAEKCLEGADIKVAKTKAKLSLSMGKYSDAVQQSDYLIKGKQSLQNTTFVKAESLYRMTEFEQALKLFYKGSRMYPDMGEFKLGITKCAETIVNMLDKEDAFDKVDDYIKDKKRREKRAEELSRKILEKRKRHKVKLDPKFGVLEKDRKFLKDLCTTLQCEAEEEARKPTADKSALEGEEEDFETENTVLIEHTTEILAYLNSRHSFWNQTGKI